MKICYVAVDVGIPYPRGASVHVHQVSKSLAAAGHEVHVVCRRYSQQQPEQEFIDGFHVHRIYRGILAPIPFSSYGNRDTSFLSTIVLRTIKRSVYRFYLHSIYLFYAMWHIVRVVQSYDLEIILERETSMGSGALASMITRRPMILEINGPHFSIVSLKQAKKILAYPRNHKRLLQLGVPKTRLHTLAPAVDLNVFKANPNLGVRVKQKLGLGSSPVVGYVGIFAPWHGVETLLKASKIVLKSIPETKFIMVGPYWEDSLKKTRDLEIADAFLFLGPVDYEDVPKYINASDVMVAPFDPSKSETTRNGRFTFIPFKILEYMSCGKSIVSTSAGSIPEILENGRTGIIVKPGDETDLAEALLKLLRNPSLAEQMGRRGKSLISEKNSWENHTDALIKLFDEVMTTTNVG